MTNVYYEPARGIGGRVAAGVNLKPYVSGDSAYVVLDGELDLARKDEVAAALPAAESIKACVINLGRATYVDSVVMGLLVRFRREFTKNGGDPRSLIIVLPKSGATRRAFESTGLNRLFSIAYVESTPIEPEEYIAGHR